jgi:hypothetical protein
VQAGKTIKEERRHALDDLRDTSGAVAVGDGELYTLGGYIHILLVVAIVVVLIRVIQGRNPV